MSPPSKIVQGLGVNKNIIEVLRIAGTTLELNATKNFHKEEMAFLLQGQNLTTSMSLQTEGERGRKDAEAAVDLEIVIAISFYEY